MLKRSYIKAFRPAFTLTEVLLAVVIVGIIAALVLPAVITKFQDNIFDHSYKREVQSILDSVDKLAVDENQTDFHHTIMYLDNEVAEGGNYNANSGAFLKKYFKISRYCGDDKTNCFASKYYNYENRTRKTYTFEAKGSCAILKNGMSICISPQIGETPIQGWIDLNGKKGPNVLNRDLRPFSIDPQTKTALNTETKEVETINKIICRNNPDSKECCEYQGINNDNKSYCCAYDGLNKDPLCCEVNGVNDSNQEYCCGLTSYYDNAECCRRGYNQTNPTCCGVNGINDSNHNFCCAQSTYSGTSGCCIYGHNYNSAECCRHRGLGSISSPSDVCCSLVPEFANNGACKTNSCPAGTVEIADVGCVKHVMLPQGYCEAPGTTQNNAFTLCANQGMNLPNKDTLIKIRNAIQSNPSIKNQLLYYGGTCPAPGGYPPIAWYWTSECVQIYNYNLSKPVACSDTYAAGAYFVKIDTDEVHFTQRSDVNGALCVAPKN